MEHKLIRGGEQFLPFARSRIAAMRAAGLTYASQQFQVDGVDIKVRVAGEHNYIRIDGECGFDMDSGVVDSVFIEFAAFIPPQNYTAGVLHGTAYSLGYTAAFTKLSADGNRKTNPGPSNQLAGAVMYAGGFKGSIGVGTEARSFLPSLTRGVGDVWADTAEDYELYKKKRAARYCPASVFTGRCRLYVQALYGAPLYPTEAARKEHRPSIPFSLSGDTHQYQPKLNIKSYVHSGDNAAYADIPLHTSCGVWLDRATGKHWLFEVYDKLVNIYPLVADACGTAARKLLKTGSSLSAEDQDHLEAYILSSCLPDRSRMQTATYAAQHPGTSMGYGWHWNYSGTRADIAKNNTVAVDESDHSGSRVLIMSSSHHSLTVSKHDVSLPEGNTTGFAQTWTAQLETISSNSRWGVERGIFCITAPSGGTYIEKQTPYRLNSYSPTNMYAGSGTFYVYYVGDDLKLCTVQAVYHPPQGKTWKSSNSVEVHPTGPNPHYVMNIPGSGGAFIEVMDTTTEYWSVSFDMAGASSTMEFRKDEVGWRVDVSGTHHTSVVYPGYSAGGGYEYYARIEYGAPQGSSTAPTWANYLNLQNGYLYGGSSPSAADRKRATLKKYSNCLAVIAVPHGDSQAVFTSFKKWTQVDRTLSYTQKLSINFTSINVLIHTWTDGGGGFHDDRSGFVYKDNWWDASVAGFTSTEYLHDDIVTEDLQESQTLMCAAGAIPATTFQYCVDAILHETAVDVVNLDMATISSAATGGVVMSGIRVTPRGIAPGIEYPVIVGWA